MKLLLIGGAGYVGSACLRWLVKHGHDPIAFDDLSTGNAASVPADRLIVGDMLNVQQLREVMQQHAIEGVMHFAALASVPESIAEPERYYRVNVLGTKCVLDAMLACNVDRIVFSSTAATYGFTDDMPLREDALQQPQVPYGSTKLAAEWLIRDYANAYGIGGMLLRYFNASGADLDGNFGESRDHETHLIPLTLQVATGQREELMIYGDDYNTPDGTCVRDYIHTDDLAQAHQLAIEAIEPGDVRAYNLGSGQGISVMQVLRACEAAVGRAIPHRIAARRPGDPGTLIASSQRITDELGWKPRYPLIEQIVDTAWKWHQSHPRGYAT
jgi:UDP-glucose 4-epimerase